MRHRRKDEHGAGQSTPRNSNSTLLSRVATSVPAQLEKAAEGALTPARKVFAHASNTLTSKSAPDHDLPVLTPADIERLQAVQEELRILAKTVSDRRLRRRLNLARECLGEVGRRPRDGSLARLHRAQRNAARRARNPLNPLDYPGYLRSALSRI